MKTYKSNGLVYGNYWGGGAGSYQAENLEGKTFKSIIKQAEEGIANGSLDAGMGFESLKGALLEIETIETIEKNGKEYTNIESELQFIGDLSENEMNFLEEIYFND